MKNSCIALSVSCALALLTGTLASAEEGFTSLFDGKSLDGWRGQDTSFWSVEDGAITGTISKERPIPMNQYLIWQGGLVEDFELKLDFRLTGSTTPNTNGGFQFRSRRLPNGDVAGYQMDNNFGQPWKVRLYDEFGRHDLARENEQSVFVADGKRSVEPLALESGALDFRLDEWHEYHLIAMGPKLILRVNGKLVAATTDQDADSFEARGILAMQLHTGPPQKAQFRNLRLKPMGRIAVQGSRDALLAEAALHWQLGERPNSHQPPLKPVGDIAFIAGGERRAARMKNAWFDVAVDLNQPKAWNAPGSAVTVHLTARVPDGSWNSALFAKRGNHDICNFNLFSVDLPNTPGSDIGFEIHTEKGFFMTSFPVSKIDAAAWHGLTGRYDGKTLQVLCDGKVMSETLASGLLTQNAEPLMVGAETNNGVPGRFFTGDMEEAALWTRALTDAELAAVLNLPRPK